MRLSELMVLGATGGIGLAIVKQFYQYADRIILVARDEEKLMRLTNSFPDSSKFQCEVCDIRDFQSSKALIKSYQADLIINCIGIGTLEKTESIDITKIRESHDVNFESVARIMTYWMSNAKDTPSIFLNLASLASLFPHPYLSLYSASKAALYHFSLAVNAELRQAKSSLRVYTYVLGPIKTSFFPIETQENIGFLSFQMSPATLALKMFNCINHKQDYAIIGKRYKVLVLLLKCLPIRLVLKIMSHILKRGL